MKISNSYELSLDQVANMIARRGHENTMLVQGHMGTGKSSMLKVLAGMFPDFTPCYFDCTTKDLGDITVPVIREILEEGAEMAGAPFVRYATNEELGMHLEKPIILMVDEYGKANPAVKTALNRVLLERKLGAYTMHPASLVFATTNLGQENVGDLLPAHSRNRITVVTMRKPTAEEWLAWAVNNGIDVAVMAWVRDNPQVLQDFREVSNPDANPYIFHPQSGASSFVTPRSLELASGWTKARSLVQGDGGLDEHEITAALIGTIGERAALDLLAYLKLADKLPSLQSIIDDPKHAVVPDNPATKCMVVYRSLLNTTADMLTPWMEYLRRLPTEMQAMYMNCAISPKYEKRNLVVTNMACTTWLRENHMLYAADKK